MSYKVALRSGQWWRAKETGDSPGLMVNASVEQCAPYHESVCNMMRRHARAYGCETQLFSTSSIDTRSVRSLADFQPTNVFANIIESLQADVYKSRLFTMHVTDRASWKQQRQARDISDFCDGVEFESQCDMLTLLWGMHILLFGTAIAKVVENMEGRIELECTPRWELRVDPFEARYGKPRTIYHRYTIDRGQAFEMWCRDDFFGSVGSRERRMRVIDQATYVTESWMDAVQTSNADRITVTEAYHLPSGPDAKDGRIVITTSGAAEPEILDAPYTQKTFPFRWTWSNVPLVGIDGESVAARLMPNHEYLAYVDARTREGHAVMSLPRIWAPTGTMPQVEHISQHIASVLISDAPPQVLNWSAFSPEWYQFREALKQEMYEISGTNQMSTNGQIPTAFRNSPSGIALQTMDDQYTARHAAKFKLLEWFTVQRAELIKQKADEICDRDGEYEVKVASPYGLRTLRWSEIRNNRDAFVMKAFSVSALPKSPGAKLDKLMQLWQAQIISPHALRRALNTSVDVSGELELEAAPYDVILDTLERIVEDGEMYTPEPFDDLALCKRIAQLFYAQVRLYRDVPPERKAMLRDFIQRTQKLIDAQKTGADAAATGALPPSGGPPPTAAMAMLAQATPSEAM